MDRQHTPNSMCDNRTLTLRRDLREDEIGVSFDAPRSAIAAHLQRRDLSRDLDLLRPTNGGRWTDIKPRSRLTTRHPALDRFHHLFANIHR